MPISLILQVRVTPNDGTEDGSAATSASFEVDNLDPSALASLVIGSYTATTATLTWTAAVEANFNHYEIWYGTTQAHVESRSDTALEWDDSDDGDLTTLATATTTITGLTEGDTYYFRNWAIDNYGNIFASATVTQATNNTTTATTPSSISQATDASGYITFSTTIADTDLDDTKLKVEYSDDDGSSWYDPDLVSATPSGGSVDLDDGETYQIGTVNAIDTSGGSITLTIVWDTMSASNGNGSLDDTDQTDIKVRVTPNDGTEDGSAATSASFEVDNLDPADGVVSIDAAAVYATTTSVILTISATGADYMMISEDVGFSGASWVAYGVSSPLTLSSTNGEKTVYIKFKDDNENTSSSYSDTIILDTVVPAGSILINSGDVYTTSQTVTLTIAATDATSGVNQMMIAEDSDFLSASWVSYATSSSFDLSGGDESKTVAIKFIDNASNESISYLDTIIFDATAPYTAAFYLESPKEDVVISNNKPDFKFHIAVDGASGIASYQILIDKKDGTGEYTYLDNIRPDAPHDNLRVEENMTIKYSGSFIEVTAKNTPSTSYSLNDGNYQWKTRAINNVGFSTDAGPESFSIDTSPDQSGDDSDSDDGDGDDDHDDDG